MNRIETFLQEFVATQADTSIFDFCVNLALAAILSAILSWVYVRYGRALSDRKAFARNFMLLTMTTMLIITVVKSSLALSLGLVGALSIVRFRAAIKEPEELAYLFLTIAIGLALGANQRLIALIGFVFIVVVGIWLRARDSSVDESRNLYLTISGNNTGGDLFSKINSVLKEACASIQLKRLDESSDSVEALYIVAFTNVNEISESTQRLRELDKSLCVTFLDNTV